TRKRQENKNGLFHDEASPDIIWRGFSFLSYFRGFMSLVIKTTVISILNLLGNLLRTEGINILVQNKKYGEICDQAERRLCASRNLQNTRRYPKGLSKCILSH